ncbi:unnamed protein product [Ilex paraguariensis]|uniref:GAGA-binding transcriptional activator n=1 Tax=Ilex paraguariensis TaxID=185542 RepID=A0ABC8RU53_9AQUA
MSTGMPDHTWGEAHASSAAAYTSSATIGASLFMHWIPKAMLQMGKWRLAIFRHARVGGRKMSGSAFNKLISRLAAEGHDLSNPVDLKDNWAKHGTNRYITIK